MMSSSSHGRSRKLGALLPAASAVVLVCGLITLPAAVASAHGSHHGHHRHHGHHGHHHGHHRAFSKGSIAEGIVIAYTGPVSFEGGAADAGVFPAVNEINKAGGVLGHKMTTVEEDTKGDPADAVPLVDKMLATTSNLVGVTGPGTSSAPTIVPTLNAHKMVDMIMGGNASFDRSRLKYFWRLFPPDPANGEAMAIWARSKGYTKIAAVFGTTTGAQGDRPGVVAGLKAINAKMVASVTLTPDQASYRAEVEKVIAAHPQAIMTETDGVTAATFFSELKQLGGMVPIIGTSATVVATWLNTVRNGVGASTFTKNFSAVVSGTPTRTSATKAYKHNLKAEKAKIPSPWTSWVTNPITGAVYDGVITQALAMNAAKSTNPKKYNKYIKKVTEPGRHKKKVYTYAQGVRALKHGKKIQYYGVTGLIHFDKYHNSFANETAVTVNAQDTPTVVKLITEKQIAKLG